MTSNVWLDDVRPMPKGYDVHVRTAEEAIALLKTGKVRKISLDHDLGEEMTGYDVAKFIEAGAVAGTLAPIDCLVHSQNVVGAAQMRMALVVAEKHWREHVRRNV